MNKNKQGGFSLIELLFVITILTIIASLAIPALMKARNAAENQGAFSTLRTMSTLQVRFYSQNNRFARLDELNAAQGNSLGTVSGTVLTRGRFSYEMDPIGSQPTDADLKNAYKITATRNVGAGESPYVIYVNQSGAIAP